MQHTYNDVNASQEAAGLCSRVNFCFVTCMAVVCMVVSQLEHGADRRQTHRVII